MTIEFIDNRNRFFEDVKALGRKNSATLGVIKMVQLYVTYITASFSALIEETDMSKYGDIVPFETAQITNNEIVPIELAQTMVALYKEQLQVGSVIKAVKKFFIRKYLYLCNIKRYDLMRRSIVTTKTLKL